MVEGTLHAIRDVETVVTNRCATHAPTATQEPSYTCLCLCLYYSFRWPVGKNEWQTVSKKLVKPVLVKELVRGDYFGGEKNKKRKIQQLPSSSLNEQFINMYVYVCVCRAVYNQERREDSQCRCEIEVSACQLLL